ncbi:unnamed protein product [Cyprideis torosa]|uniref:Uncharacterized protein n=1 Tax=Cyprideis torosa TaxID=163714 RepID=A0A7R8VZW8_9CRUS|nr:unnamed protein product [Cyprideis torosa]CAG0879104.1 unnamed protein product [Cyprideis torosa]
MRGLPEDRQVASLDGPERDSQLMGAIHGFIGAEHSCGLTSLISRRRDPSEISSLPSSGKMPGIRLFMFHDNSGMKTTQSNSFGRKLDLGKNRCSETQ